LLCFIRHDGLLREVIEGRMRGKPTRRRRIQMLRDFEHDDGYVALNGHQRQR